MWTPIDYFDNAVICKLIEDRKVGIIDRLDEECLRPGEATTETLMDKFNAAYQNHRHYVSRETARSDKTLGPLDFRLKHYAGDVQYAADGFIDKNKDLLFRDLMYTMNSSTNKVVLDLFPESASQSDLKRPDSAGTQFRNSMDQLMKNLLAKNPHYVRCIKPNDRKAASVFQDDMCLHQVRYLGLLENVRVKRAGFCFRQKYEKFVERYKMLCRETWPSSSFTDLRDAALAIVKAQGLGEQEYQLGRTKVFIRNPLTLFQLESDRNVAKHRLATKIKARYLAHVYSRRYQKMRESVTLISATFRGHHQRQEYVKMRKSAIFIAAVVRGFIARLRYRVMKRKLPKHAVPYLQRAARVFLRRKFLRRLATIARQAGSNWRGVKWPTDRDVLPPMRDAAKRLGKMYQLLMAYKYRRALTPERKLMLEEKLCASELFKGKRDDYAASVGVKFKGDQLSITQSASWAKTGADASETAAVVSFAAAKRHRSNLKYVPRAVAFTTQAFYNTLPAEKQFKPSARVPIANITGVSVTSGSDGIIVLHVTGEKKGDFILIASNGNDVVRAFFGCFWM